MQWKTLNYFRVLSERRFLSPRTLHQQSTQVTCQLLNCYYTRHQRRSALLSLKLDPTRCRSSSVINLTVSAAAATRTTNGNRWHEQLVLYRL
jgi:hypothetical protein